MDIAVYPEFVPNSRICGGGYCLELAVLQHSKYSPALLPAYYRFCSKATCDFEYQMEL